MDHEEARKKVIGILGVIRFDGHFNKCFDNIKKSQQEEIISWIKDCKDRKTSPIMSKKDCEIIGFVKKIGSNVRAILTKEKQGYFLSLFLDKHKYYEEEAERLGF